MLIAYLVLQLHIALKAHTTRVFQIAFGGIGGTELRLLLAFANVIVLVRPELLAAATPLAWSLTALVVGLVSVDAWRTARALDREERRAWSE
jgi:hypothetical protein